MEKFIDRSKEAEKWSKIIIDSYRAKQYDQCLNFIESAFEKFPKSLTYKLIQAECWLALNVNIEKIIKSLKETIADHPDCSIAYYNLGHTYYRQGDLKESIDMLDKAAQLDPTRAMLKATELKVQAQMIVRSLDDGEFEIIIFFNCF